ncbi:MAG: cytochrome P460 family protein [Chloroflexi bacterium]|nr:cytochrome P460 family protein [Chloroflexota bacterium]
MKRPMSLLALFIGLSLALTACTRAPAPTAEVDATSVYRYITAENDYHNWKMWPGRQALYLGQEPHGFYLTTYVTDSAFSAIEGKQGSIPDGSIIIKENYTPDKVLDAVTVMYKVKGFYPRNNDWFWMKYTPDGTIAMSGRVNECISCHGKKRANDFIYTSDLR